MNNYRCLRHIPDAHRERHQFMFVAKTIKETESYGCTGADYSDHQCSPAALFRILWE